MMEVAVEQATTPVAPAESIVKPAALPATVPLSTTSTTPTPAPDPAPPATTPATTTAAEPVEAPAPAPATDGPPPPPPPTSSALSAAASAAATAATAAAAAAAAASTAGPTKATPPPAAARTAPEELNGDKPAVDGDPDLDPVIEPTRRHKKKKNGWETESELSEPDSNLHSPAGAVPIVPSPQAKINELDDVIVVGARADGAEKPSSTTAVPTKEDEDMTDAPTEEPMVSSHYPKRKRTSIFEDLSESKIEIPTALTTNKPPAQTKAKVATRPTLGSDRGVLLGYWRDSQAPDLEHKHAVIGFIDVRDRLRTRLQANNRRGESLTNSFPLPPGPGGTWVTFERIVFEPHLVGLDHFQVKEYVRIRAEAGEETEEQRAAGEKEAVLGAVQRVKDNPLLDNPAVMPMIAYGAELPEAPVSPRPDSKRRRTSGGFATINPAPAIAPAPANGTASRDASMPPPHQPASALAAIKNPHDPLLGNRPTRILVGHWKGSSETDPKDRHAIYGILGQNDMFRVKLVRETRDGRFLDGNFPLGAGALWVNYEEVEFEPHLSNLSRGEIKEYCRVRQWQIDNGEQPEDRINNETTAVYDAQDRLNGANFKQAVTPIAPAVPLAPAASDDNQASEQTNGRTVSGGHDLRQSRREAKLDGRSSRHSLPDSSSDGRSATRAQTVDAQERTTALARREIARAEAAQGRADRLAVNRERAAAAAAADAASAAAAATVAASTSPALTNGRMRFHESEDMQRLNKVWARQESLRAKAGAEDAKVYDGVKYERKGNGPFMGKLVSQGSIINIDGEDYVEYRVLTKPSFF